MSKKNRKRREAARRQKEQRQAKLAARAAQADEDAEAPEDTEPEDEAARIRRRAEQKREYEQRKRARARGGQSLAPYFWGGGIAAVIAVAALGGFLLLSGGGDDNGGTTAATATPDPRIAGLPIDRTIEIETDDEGQNVNTRFVPNSLTGEAGEVIEIIVTNVGSVAHNLSFPGLDGEYDTPDDWLADPFALQPGDTGRLVVKFDDPDVYPFRCAFHPQIHTGTLTLS